MLCGESTVWTEAYGPATSDKKEAIFNEFGRTLDVIVVQKDKNICQIIDLLALMMEESIPKKKLVKGNRYWNSDNGVAENRPPKQCSIPLKGSWGLMKLVVTGPQMLHNQIIMMINFTGNWQRNRWMLRKLPLWMKSKTLGEVPGE